MYYSLTFGKRSATGGITGKNTWSDWKLIPDSPPMVDPPEPIFNLIDIPGRIQGPLDLSRVPFNRLLYKRMSGSWTFYSEVYNKNTRIELFENIRSYLHGQSMYVGFEEDPRHYFNGRFTVSAPRSSTGPIQITIGYDLEPVRYNNNGTIDTTYVQN